MISEGDIVLFRFPQSDLQGGKLRPALLLKKIPSQYDDWLVCMISSQLRHRIEDFALAIFVKHAEIHPDRDRRRQKGSEESYPTLFHSIP